VVAQPSSRSRVSLTTFCRSIDGQLLAYFVEKLRFRRCSKDCGPSEASFNFGRGGRGVFALRATNGFLIDPPAIHRANWRSRFSLARTCSECVFEFFNRIGCGLNRSLQHRPKSIGRRFKAQGFSGALV
jgi:hypothetical protein